MAGGAPTKGKHMIDGFYGLMPGSTYMAMVKTKRRWWQFWRPRFSYRWVEATVPPPNLPNCRCTLAPHVEGEPV